MGFKKLGVFFLLLSVQLHSLLALRQTSLLDPFRTRDLDQESVPKRLVKLGEKQNIAVVNKRGGGGGGSHGGGGHAGGGGRGSEGGGKGSGGAVIVVSQSHHSDGDALNYVSLYPFIFVFLASFCLVLF